MKISKSYDVDVNADSKQEAIETAMQSQAKEIQENGILAYVEVDQAEVL